MLLSLFPFCGLLALGFAPTAAHLGRKRVFILCSGLRNFAMALLVAGLCLFGRVRPDDQYTTRIAGL